MEKIVVKTKNKKNAHTIQNKTRNLCHLTIVAYAIILFVCIKEPEPRNRKIHEQLTVTL